MGWADHEPPGGWDAPENQGGSREILPSLSTKSIFAAGVAAERARAKKQAKREAREADRLARLDRLQAMTEYPRTGPRWMKTGRSWTWHEWSTERGWWVDTGIEAKPGVPLPLQRPEGR
jgi:hypothetical protein